MSESLKRTREEDESQDFSTLSVYSYKGAVASLFLPAGASSRLSHAVLSILFGPRTHSMFSLTHSRTGSFYVFDKDSSEAFLGRAPGEHELWQCLYLQP